MKRTCDVQVYKVRDHDGRKNISVLQKELLFPS